MAKEKVVKYDVDGQPIVWLEVNPATLSKETSKLWAEYKAIYASASAARAEFEKAMTKEAALPAGRRLVIGYNFGKLSMTSLVDTGEKASKSAVTASAAFSKLKAA